MLHSAGRPTSAVHKLARMASQLSSGQHANGSYSNTGGDGAKPSSSNTTAASSFPGVTLAELPKSNVFTSKLPADAAFPTPRDSHNALRERLGPRMVKGALFTYVRPEEKPEPVLLAGVGRRAMRDVGLAAGEEKTDDFRRLVAGNKIMWEDEEEAGDPEKATDGSNAQNEKKSDDGGSGRGIYPWAQCYGGWQFGSWAGQLGDGRAISLFEATNPATKVRYELQLKGAGKTPYSRFADGRAVVRSSVREYLVSEALNGLGIPTTRALSLTLTPNTRVQRERIEPGAVVCRFAQSWLRIGTFDIQRARGERDVIRKLADYLIEEVFAGREMPSSPFPDAEKKQDPPGKSGGEEEDQSGSNNTKASELTLNRYAALFRHICLLNAKTVAMWQAYGFTNGVLNTDNTSLMGLSLDFGPFAFIDNFDPSFTPNHDDHALRYSYRNQPSIIWWNLVRLGESLGELLGSGPGVDDDKFVKEGVQEDQVDELVARAEGIIMATGAEFQREFLAEYKRLMAARLGLKTSPQRDFDQLYSEALDTLQEYELDFSHFFRRLSGIAAADLSDEAARKEKAGIFFHDEGLAVVGADEATARGRIAAWLDKYRERVIQDWGEGAGADDERMAAMKAVNPKFVARGWLLDEIIRKVQDGHDFDVLDQAMRMAEEPFREEWGGDRDLEERWCGDVPKRDRGIMCSCSS